MYKKLLLLIAVICCASCTKNKQQNTACGTQTCTAIFATVGVLMVDKDNNPITLKELIITDLRTNKVFTPTYKPDIDYVAGYVIIADDSNLKDISTEGDMIRVSASSAIDGKLEIATFKISGGCNCHVTKISGPDKIVFN